MHPLELSFVGKSNLRVTRLGLGGAGFGGSFRDVPEETAVVAVKRALELGINFFDTAPVYGCSKSELRVGRVLSGRSRNSFVLATKVGRLLVPRDPDKDAASKWENPPRLRPVFDFSYDGAMRSFEESLKRLGMDRVDILYIHDPDDHYDEAISGAYPALRKLRSEGVIGAIGVGMNQAEMLARFAREGDFDCFLLAGRYTLIDHTGLRELLPLCVEKCISVIIGGPYNSGILATGARPLAQFDYEDAALPILEKVRKCEEICSRHGVPLKAAALQFPLAHPAVAAVIPGAESAAEIEDNFKMASYPIPRDFWADLRRDGVLPSGAPVPGEGA
jgi:D-threo-aldose 1-dehydrogenase